MGIGGTRTRKGGQLVVAAGIWLAALPAGAGAQFFSGSDSSFAPRPPLDVPSVAPGPAQSLIPPSGNLAPSAASKGPMLQSLPGTTNPAVQAHAVPNALAAPPVPAGQGALAVSARFGLASVTKAVQVRAETMKDVYEIPAGGLRCEGRVGDARIPQGQISFDLYKGSQFEPGDKRPIATAIMTGDIVLLPEGAYHIVSNYGDANATVRSDIRVEVGKLTDATITHRAAIITLKLVNERGGDARANTQWSVLTPGGDVIKESIGAFPRVILAEGEYRAIARNDNRTYEGDFRVVNGVDSEVEIVAR